MGTHMHNTGLFQKYGPVKAEPNKGGEYVTTGQMREITFDIDLTELTETETILSDTVFFPKMRIAEVEVFTHTAAATGVAIDLGLQRTDRSTEIDYNGLLAALPTADMNADGEKQTVGIGHTYVGALVGTTTTNVGYITCSRTTSTAFTAGRIFVTIRYYAV